MGACARTPAHSVVRFNVTLLHVASLGVDPAVVTPIHEALREQVEGHDSESTVSVALAFGSASAEISYEADQRNCDRYGSLPTTSARLSRTPAR